MIHSGVLRQKKEEKKKKACYTSTQKEGKTRNRNAFKHQRSLASKMLEKKKKRFQVGASTSVEMRQKKKSSEKKKGAETGGLQMLKCRGQYRKQAQCTHTKKKKKKRFNTIRFIFFTKRVKQVYHHPQRDQKSTIGLHLLS